MEKDFLEKLAAMAGKSEEEIKKYAPVFDCDGISIYPDSIHAVNGAVVMTARDDKSRFLIVIGKEIPSGFSGTAYALADGVSALACLLSAENAAALRKYFPWCAPVSLRKVRTTIGCGDRLGLATSGHLAAAKRYDVCPVLAQQSMRELTMTGRTFQNVVDDAVFLVFQNDYRAASAQTATI